MNYNSSRKLFSERILRDYLGKRMDFALNQISNHDPEKFLKTSIHDLEDYYYSEYMVEPIELNEDKIVADVEDTKIDVSNERGRYIRDRSKPFHIPGTLTSIEVPFTGNEQLLYMRASTFTHSIPNARTKRNKLIFRTASQTPTSNVIQKQFNSWLNQIKKLLSYSEKDINQFNSTLKQKIKSKLQHRRKKLLRDRELENSLKFPLKKRKGNNTFVTDQVKKKIKPKFPTPSEDKFEPEPTIQEKDYELILDIIDKTATMLERSPSTFKNMKEEQLRNQFLVPLNSHFEGQATGETFNAEGKTDILIREDDKCLFIAECKVWRGKQYFLDAIDQLLSYTTWRDSKTSILIFNRNKDFSSVLEKIPGIVNDHNSFKKELDTKKENSFKFIIAKESDINRDIHLTILALDVPT
jgi:hypothetical protein